MPANDFKEFVQLLKKHKGYNKITLNLQLPGQLFIINSIKITAAHH
ncbi:MAG: hypothetical protein JWO32_1127 [Bacteroidetes bacterium]|nr:hypothetical protein [Bacteroidota bacterium]